MNPSIFIRCAAFLTGTALAGVLPASALTLYVAPDGNDSFTGQSAQVANNDGPFQTLARVQKEIRQRNASHTMPADGVTVEMAPGRYFISEPLSLNDQDSGKSGAPITYRARELGKTIITGAVQLTQTGPVTDPVALSLLRPEAQGHVVQIDLSSYFKDGVPGFCAGSSYFAGKPDLPIWLFQNGTRLKLAQWPAQGWAKTGNYDGPSTGTGLFVYFSSGKFHFDNERLPVWAKEPDLWGYGSWGIEWVDQRLPIASIDVANKTVQLAKPETNQLGYQPKRDFVFFNAISEIGQPGDWAVDRTKKRLYVWPAVDPAQSPLELAVTKDIIEADGAQSLHFQGLIFEGTRDTVLTFLHGRDIQLHGCTVRHANGAGIHVQDSDHCSVLGSDLYDLGRGGIFLGGGDRQALTPSENTVENCHIYDFGKFISMYQPGVELGWLSVGARVQHNLIHDCAHTAILFDGNDHLIEYNIIHDACQHASDVGAIYCCARDWSKRGTVIRYNLIHALLPAGNTDARRGIYLDDQSSGITVTGNIITMGSAGFHLGGGKDVSFTNNLVLLCDQAAVEYSSRGIDSFAADDAKMGYKSREFVGVYQSPYQTPIWRARYPELIPELQGDPVKAHDAANNTIENNIFACCADMHIDNAAIAMKTSKVDHNANIDGDPGLVDPAKLDFALKPEAIGLKECPGFKALPLEKMGLYPDPQRASPAVRFGPHVTPLRPLLSRLEASRAWRQAIVTTVQKGVMKIDGSESPGEWDTSLNKAIVCSVPLTANVSKYSADAWAQTDGQSLYLLLVVDHDPAKPLIQTGAWGVRDGFEIVVRNPKDPNVPTGHFHFYTDGTLETVPFQYGSEKWAADLQKQTAYAVKTTPQRWTAEVSLPLAALGVGPNDKVFFNINIRRMSDDSWTGWVKPLVGFADSGDRGVLCPTAASSP